jgi:N-acetylmuramoyl-L-alanine amidase
MPRLSRRILSFAAVLAATGICSPSHQLEAAEPRIEAIRFWSFGDVTRIAVETHGEYRITSDHLDNPPRLFVDLHGLRPPAAQHKGVQVMRVGDRLIRQIRVAETEPGVTRIVFDLEVPVEFSSSQLVNPDRLMIELRPKSSATPEMLTRRSRTGSERIRFTAPASNPVVKPAVTEAPNLLLAGPAPQVPFPDIAMTATMLTVLDPRMTVPQYSAPVTRSARTRRAASNTRSTLSHSNTREDAAVQKVAAEPAAPAFVDQNNSSLVRVFGLKIHKVVIDAGHGGHDTGTIGSNGLMEKDLVLDVALRLGKMIEQRLRADVIYTRHDDTFIPLEERTRIANIEKADLFISIHANSSPASSATGVETYYFNFTSDQNALKLATRENASSTSSIFQLNDLLHKAVLNAKVEESRDFAQKVETSLYAMSVRMNKKSRNRGVKKAPFVVLIGATMPSILAEIGFVSNPHDAKLLRREDQRKKIAESLYKGVSAYASTLSHAEMANAN